MTTRPRGTEFRTRKKQPTSKKTEMSNRILQCSPNSSSSSKSLKVVSTKESGVSHAMWQSYRMLKQILYLRLCSPRYICLTSRDCYWNAATLCWTKMGFQFFNEHLKYCVVIVILYWFFWGLWIIEVWEILFC